MLAMHGACMVTTANEVMHVMKLILMSCIYIFMFDVAVTTYGYPLSAVL